MNSPAAPFLSDEQPVRPDLQNLQAIPRENFTVEWGTRESDNALVIHLFPKIVGDKMSKDWDPAYRPDKRLDYAIPAVFDVKQVHAGYEKEYESFFVIVRGVIAPDLRLLVQRFIELIEGAPLPH